MKTKMLFFIITHFFVFSLDLSAQSTIPKGKAQLIEFTNANAKFTVPEGKTWVLYNVFSDYVVDGVMKTDDYTKKIVFSDDKPVRIFLKELNGVEKTNYLMNVYGTQFYHSNTFSTGISYPLLFPEKTSFGLILLKGSTGYLQLYNGAGYISLIEVDN
jgi:hypothetical protein